MKRGLVDLIKSIVRQVIKSEMPKAAQQAAQDAGVPQVAPSVDEGTRAEAVRNLNAKYSGVSQAHQKKISSITKNWAKRIINMGPRVPPAVQQAALEAMSGVGNDKDHLEVFRAYENVSRSGATGAKAAMRPVRAMVGAGARAATLMNTIAQGGVGAAFAGGELFNLGTRELANISNRKTFQGQAWQAMSSMLWEDPAQGSRIAKSISRFAKKMGVLGDAAALGYSIGGTAGAPIGNWFADISQLNRAAAEGDAFDVARRSKIDNARAIAEATRIRAEEDLEGGWWIRKYRRGMNDNTDFEGKVKERLQAREAQIVRARNLAADLGIDVAAVLAKKAASLGKTMSELTERERTNAIDDATQNILDVNNRLKDPRIENRLALQSPAEKAMDVAKTEAQMNAKRARIAGELINDDLNDKERRREEARLEGEKTMTRLFDTPEKWAALRRELRKASTEYDAWKSRHQQVELD